MKRFVCLMRGHRWCDLIYCRRCNTGYSAVKYGPRP